MATETLKDYVLSQSPPPASEYQIRPYYSKVGDFVSFCWAPERFYTRRVDEFLTLYHSAATNKVVGCKIKGIRYLVGEAVKMLSGKHPLKPTIKTVSVVGRGLASQPASLDEYEDVWENGQVEIEDPALQPC